uniref:hypothetical protein n=1 Tax=uncultured Sphingomonas sp. TaxID=158754 RepID=UPI0035CA876C
MPDRFGTRGEHRHLRNQRSRRSSFDQSGKQVVQLELHAFVEEGIAGARIAPPRLMPAKRTLALGKAVGLPRCQGALEMRIEHAQFALATQAGEEGRPRHYAASGLPISTGSCVSIFTRSTASANA